MSIGNTVTAIISLRRSTISGIYTLSDWRSPIELVDSYSTVTKTLVNNTPLSLGTATKAFAIRSDSPLLITLTNASGSIDITSSLFYSEGNWTDITVKNDAGKDVVFMAHLL